MDKPLDFLIEYKTSNQAASPQLEHYHDFFELDFFVQANINLFLKDECLSLEDRSLLFINAYDLHRVVCSSHADYTRYVVHFSREFIQPFFQASGVGGMLNSLAALPSKRAGLTLKQANEIENLFKGLLRIHKRINHTPDPAALWAQIKSYLLIILAWYKDHADLNKTVYRSDSKQVKIREIVGYIDSNFKAGLSLDTLQNAFNMSKFHISHLFKEVTGFTVSEYIQHRRVIEAQKMLRTTGLTVLDICLDCGFNNINHFHRVFKKIAKTTPYKYKRSIIT